VSFVKDLKRRNVFRVGAAYLVIAWLIAQVSQLALDSFGAPDWIIKSELFLLAVGFPVALVFAWAFELTPEGIKRDRDVGRDEPGPRVGGRKLDFIIIGALVIALGYFLWERQQITAPPATLDRSVAVLPFVNLSSDEEQEYFSDGLSEELLNLLAKVPELQVSARTSSFSFKGKDLEIREIASRLKVAHILEGSVRKSGNQIRITAQLVQADNGYQLWSESYDRDLDNIFQIQEEIAIAVVNALKITLLGDVPKTRKTDPQAYQLFLEGRYLARQITPDSLSKAIEAFKQAVEIDATYVPAWASLADAYIWVGENDLADQAIQIAISADPGYAWSYYARGIIRIFSKSRFKEGIEDFEHALKLDPDNAIIVGSIGKGASVTGKYDVAIEQFQAGLRLEPVTPEFYFFLGIIYRGSGRLDDSEASYRKMLSLSPQSYLGHFSLWHTLFLKGEFDAALAELEHDTNVSRKAIGLAITHYALGNEAQSDEILADLIEDAPIWDGYGMAMVYGYRGEVDKAFEWLNQALETEKSNLVWILGETAFHGLHSDPRWQPLLEKTNLLEYWLEMPPEWGGPQ
jgi:TolB-like protein/Flp pilus assembly protein TadD